MSKAQHPPRRLSETPPSTQSLCQTTLDRIAAGRRHFGFDRADNVASSNAIESIEVR